MTYFFRVDSSPSIGIGHLMRCMTLAHELRILGYDCYFLCLDIKDNSSYLLKQKEYKVFYIENNEMTENQDAEISLSIIKSLKTKTFSVIVDSYNLSEVWESQIKPFASQIIVIDDLADRKHNCDILIDQTYGRVSAEYKDLVNESCSLKCGSNYILLRPEFLGNRAESMRIKEGTDSLKSILISVGGTDHKNITFELLNFFTDHDFFRSVDFTIILSSKAPHLLKVQNFISSSERNFRLILDADNVAELMKTSDLAFGASGSSNWERCCLGLPTFLIVTAGNQKKIAYEMLKKGCVKLIELESKSGLLSEIKELFLNIDRYKAMVNKSFSVCDGLGLGRIIQELVPVYSKNGEKLTLRKVLGEDSELLYKWQSHKNTRKYSRNTSIPTFEEHSSWFTSKIKDLSSYFFIVESDGQPAGVVRLEFKELLNYEISIYLDPDCYGQGMGKGALQLVKIFFPQFYIHAFVLEENTASQSLFETAGFTRKSPTEFILNPQKDN